MQLKNTANKNILLNTGIIGYSKGNGHIFSYPAISNASFSSDVEFVKNEYPNILIYLKKNKKKFFNKKKIFNINKVFTQNKRISKSASNFSNISNIYNNGKKLIDESDVIIICRNNVRKNHKDVMYSIKKKKPILIDKLYARTEDELKKILSIKRKPLLNSTPLVFEKKFLKLNKKKITMCKCYIKKDFFDYGNHVLEPIIYYFQIKKLNNIRIKKKCIEIQFDKMKLLVFFHNKRNLEFEFFNNKKLVTTLKVKNYFFLFQELLKLFRDMIIKNKKNIFEDANLFANFIILKTFKKLKQRN